jgi:hypothetical protein
LRYIIEFIAHSATRALPMASSSAMSRSVSFFLQVLLLVGTLASGVAHAQAETEELHTIDQEIQLTRDRLKQAAAELRDAKLLAAEKLMEFETARAQFLQDDSPVNANTLDHSQQRLALAEMGVESRTAKFERVQKRLEELALLKQQSEIAAVETKPAPQPAEKKRPQPRPQIAATEPATKIHNLPPQPIFSLQGKLTDALTLGAELQKLERHLLTVGNSADAAVKVKAFGTAIPGELNLSPLGGNQYFARFTAPVGQVSLIVGARLEDYLRSALTLEFSPQEQGEEFVLIVDLNQPKDPRTLVFPKAMMFEKNLFAAHNDY